MRRADVEEYRRNLVRLTSTWLLVLDADDLGPSEDLDIAAIRKAKDTLLSIDEEVADYEEEEDSLDKEELVEEELGEEEPDLLRAGMD